MFSLNICSSVKFVADRVDVDWILGELGSGVLVKSIVSIKEGRDVVVATVFFLIDDDGIDYEKLFL